MEEVLSHYADLKKDRRIKKCLLTRTVGKLKAVVSNGADAQADSVDNARSHARQFIDEIDNLNIKMKHILLENDIAFENDNEGKPVSTERLQDIEMNVAELGAREREKWINCTGSGCGHIMSALPIREQKTQIRTPCSPRRHWKRLTL